MYYKNENKAPEEMPESYKLLPPEGNVFGYGKWTFSDEQEMKRIIFHLMCLWVVLLNQET